MIYKNGKEIISVFKGKQVISTMYKGTRLIWQSIRSCFGAGYWVNDKPWLNDEGWKNK